MKCCRPHRFAWIFPAILLFSCNRSGSEQDEGNGPALYARPQSIPLDLANGYRINVVTGDSIQPLINSLGDTLRTGVPVPVTGTIINLDTMARPVVIPAKNGVEVSANANLHMVPENVQVQVVEETKLKKVKFGEGVQDYVLVNSTGDTIPTGVPLPVKSTSVAFKYSRPVKALAMRMNDNATSDLQYLDVDQGMSASYVTSILQDRNGNMWMGTNGAGVNVYNGSSFLHFTTRNGLAKDHIWDMIQDKKGQIWLGTYGGGVNIYDGKTITTITEKEGLSSNDVRVILEDSKGRIWLGTNGKGVSIYDGKTITHLTKKEGLAGHVIGSIMEDNQGRIWIGTFGAGVTLYDGNTFTQFTENDGLCYNRVLSLLQDKKGRVWMGTVGQGLSIYDGKTFTHLSEKEGLGNNDVRSLLEDQEGNIWIGTEGGGVSRYDGKSFTQYAEKEGSGNVVRSIYQDSEQQIWLGTYGNGVAIYNPHSFVHFTEKQGLSYNIAWSMREDNEGNLWIGTDGGGMSIYNGKTFSQIREGISNTVVNSVMKDRQGRMWLATADGITVYDGKKFTLYNRAQGLPDNSISSVFQDSRGRIWISTYFSGVCMYDPAGTGEKFIHFSEKEGLASNDVRSLAEDKHGNIWMGTNGAGISVYDGKNFTHYTEKEGLGDNGVTALFRDHRGDIWIGTRKAGVACYNGKSFTHYTSKEGLSDQAAWSILEDPQGRIWVATDKGLNLLVRGEKGTQVETFTKANGLRANDFFARSAYVDSQHRAWWGGGKGLVMLEPDHFGLSQKTPAVRLNQVGISENFIDYRNLSDSAQKTIAFDSVARFENYPLGLQLPYDHNHLSFYFSAIDWKAPYKIKYQFKLQGLDADWNPVTDKTEADYRNIPYGTYTFKVRAIGESQAWSKAAEYTFTILPPWWHTWWFRALLVGVALLIVYLVFRWRTAALRRRQRVLEKTVEERTAEVVHQKEIIEEKHREITDSINYAERIQRSFMATQKMLDENLPDYFVLFQPKDVVSGDFYWSEKLSNGHFCLAAADSTGHGVPGAIMSILNITCLENAVREGKTRPADILDHTRLNIIERLKKDGSADGGKDGMDCSLLSFDLKNNRLEFALANNPLWLIRQGELMEYAPDKMPVGKHDKQDQPFTHQVMELQKGDRIYIFTDGYPDQFGGPKGKKFKYASLQKLLLELAQEDLQQTRQRLQAVFNDWKGELEQVDDVCIIGIKI